MSALSTENMEKVLLRKQTLQKELSQQKKCMEEKAAELNELKSYLMPFKERALAYPDNKCIQQDVVRGISDVNSVCIELIEMQNKVTHMETQMKDIEAKLLVIKNSEN